MKRNVVTVSAETTVEKAVAVAQANKVGCLPVLEGDKVVGIVTTNDFFYKILNPLFGLGQKGTRLKVSGGADPRSMGEGAWGGQQVRPHHQQHLETARRFAEERPDHSV